MVAFPDDWVLRQLCLLVPSCSTCGERGTPHGALPRNTTFRPEALKDGCRGTEGGALGVVGEGRRQALLMDAQESAQESDAQESAQESAAGKCWDGAGLGEDGAGGLRVRAGQHPRAGVVALLLPDGVGSWGRLRPQLQVTMRVGWAPSGAHPSSR